MSDQGQIGRLGKTAEMVVRIQLIQGEAINFFIQAQQVKLETMLEGEARHLGADCHQVTRVLKKDLVTEPELTGLGEETLVGKPIPAHLLTPMIL